MPGLAPCPTTISTAWAWARVVRVEAVPAGEHLVDQLVGGVPLGLQHASVARAAGRSDHCGSLPKGGLGVGGECAVAHSRDVYGDVEDERLLGVARSDDCTGAAALLVPFEREARQAGRQEGEVVEVGDALEGAETADAVASQLGLGVDVLNGPGRPYLAVAHHHAIGTSLPHPKPFPVRGVRDKRRCQMTVFSRRSRLSKW